ncbi:MAG: methionyl-tRNA formyltransferase [Actinomycetota bacterium]
MLDLVFMGTAPFAAPCLHAVLDAGHRVSAVVSQPDRPRGRGMKLQPSAVKEAALSRGIPVLQPEKASQPEFLEELRSLSPQVIVVVAYGQILRAPLLALPELGCINVHGSLLPELRGAAPIQWSIIRGYAETGVTTMFMDAGMDTGDMLLKAPCPIYPEDTSATLAERLAPLGASLLVETLAALETGAVMRVAQDSSKATYAPMLSRIDGAIDWSRSAVEIRNRIHGCNPSPGAFALRESVPVKLWRAEALPTETDAIPGTVLDPEKLVLATGSGTIRLLEVQPPNRSRLDSAAFARGYRIAAGEIWRSGNADLSANSTS